MILCNIASTLPNFKAPSFKKKTLTLTWQGFYKCPFIDRRLCHRLFGQNKNIILKVVLIYACYHLIPITLNTFIVFHTSMYTNNTCTLNTCIGTVCTGWVTQTSSCRITVFIRRTCTMFVTLTSIESRWTGPWAVLTCVTWLTLYNYVMG